MKFTERQKDILASSLRMQFDQKATNGSQMKEIIELARKLDMHILADDMQMDYEFEMGESWK